MTLPTARISLVTLGVADVAAATAFYEKLGWLKAPQSVETTAFLQGSNLVLGLWLRTDMIADGGEGELPRGSGSLALAINLESEADVDDFYGRAVDAGASPVKPPAKAFWGGYTGNFRDLDAHLWEVAHNPFFPMNHEGRLDLLGGTAQ
ncbi:MAG TPA: VOC family protein [Rhizobiaceae bacterium]|nr:VOC family protein [Rhizobiaceae bacterium]